MLPSLEQTVRPFEHLPVYVQKFIANRPVEPDDAQAYLRWGRKGRFGQAELQEEFSVGIVSRVIAGPEDPQRPKPTQPKTHNFEEVSRKTSTIRVENPANPKHYVMVERINEITFKGPRLAKEAAANMKQRSRFEPTWDSAEEREANNPATNYDFLRFVFKNRDS